jgi:transcriptional regulator with XRE-family HTH domain
MRIEHAENYRGGMRSESAYAFIRCLAAILMEERERQELSKKGLSEVSGIDRAALVRAERGNVNAGLAFLFDWCKGLNLEVSEAVKRAEERLAAEPPTRAARSRG